VEIKALNSVRIGINYKGSQGQTERALVQQEEEYQWTARIVFKITSSRGSCEYGNELTCFIKGSEFLE
jgi:hypothetical protein